MNLTLDCRLLIIKLVEVEKFSIRENLNCSRELASSHGIYGEKHQQARLYKLKQMMYQLAISNEVSKSQIKHACYWSFVVALSQAWGHQRCPEYLAHAINMDKDLHEAARRGEDGKLEELLRSRFRDVSSNLHEHQLTAITEDTILHVVATYSGSVNCAEVLRHACPDLIKATNANGDTAIHAAALSGHLELLKYLIFWAEGHDLENGERVIRAQNEDGETALDVGVRARNVEVVEELMRADSELVHIRNFKGQSPFVLASARVGTSSVMKKIAQYMDIGYQHRWNPLHHAAYHGITLNIEKALKRNIKYASEQDESGQCPIHLAASQGHLYCIKVMIRELQDTIHQKNRDGQNVFHIAAKTGKKEIMKYLLRNLSPEFIRHVNDVDNEGNTVLHLAVKNWHHAIVYMLVGEKMTVLDAPNYEGFTPLDICEREMLSAPQFSQLLILKILKMAKAQSGRKYVKTFGGQENNEKNYKRKLEYYRGWIDTSLIVATLILAVTFAAGFTIPGGYNSQGMAALLKKPTFCIFVFFNSLATYVSLIIIVILSRVVLTSDFDSLSTAVKVCTPLLGLAVFFLAVAFTAGVFSTTSNLTWFAYTLLTKQSCEPNTLNTELASQMWAIQLKKLGHIQCALVIDKNPIIDSLTLEHSGQHLNACKGSDGATLSAGLVFHNRDLILHSPVYADP
ncbi:hypothetical protein Syun_027395 [Stephania yunnanensis]|uniref:PGG domain-containing protein n=1 Tax=Stephania yunnanensis TaxID=152371 RepID=A0AAP0EPD8_9MAGN